MTRNLTTNNHFVPQFYLKNFKNNEDYIYRYNKNTNKFEKVKNLKNTGSEDNLYTILNKEKISKKDIEVYLIQNKIDEEILLKLVTFLNGDFPTDLNNSTRSGTQEELFTFYEKRFQNVYDYILKNKDFPKFQKNYQDPETIMYNVLNAFLDKNILNKKMSILRNGYYDFLHYITNQLYRVKYLYNISEKDEIVKNISNKHQFLSKNLATLDAHINSIRLASKMIKNGLEVILVENKTQTPFITCDRPVSNTLMYNKTEEEISKVQEIKLYFPLSSDLAILWGKNKNYKNTSKKIITDNLEINILNQIIIDNSNEYIYGKSEEELKKVINFQNTNFSNLLNHISLQQNQRG